MLSSLASLQVRCQFSTGTHKFTHKEVDGYFLCTFGEISKDLCISEKTGTGFEKSYSLATNKSYSEFVERYAINQDDFSFENNLDTCGMASLPLGFSRKKTVEAAKKLAFCEAVEKFSVMDFWHKHEMSFDIHNQSNQSYTYILPKISNSGLYVCIALLKEGKSVYFGSSCSEDLLRSLDKAKQEAVAHQIACKLLEDGGLSDSAIYEKRLRFLMNYGWDIWQDRLSRKGSASIHIPDVAIDRQIYCPRFSMYYVHQTRLKGQKNYIDRNIVEVGYV